MDADEGRHLADALAAYLSPSVPAKDRRQAVGAGDLFGQIAATILPRRLVLHGEDRVLLQLSVANRRLLRILDADPALGVDKALLNSPLARESLSSLTGIAKVFETVGKQVFSIQNCRQSDPHDPTETGIPVAAIMPLSNQPSTPEMAAPDQVGQFLAELEPVPEAFLQMEGPVIRVAEGEDDALSDLIHLSRMIWGDHEAEGQVEEQPQRPQCVILAAEPCSLNGICTVLLKSGSARFVLQFEDGDATGMANLWLSCGRPVVPV